MNKTNISLRENDVMAFAIAALESIDFVDITCNATGLILYDQLFDKLKTLLI
jgi:hypothetical protein